MIVRATALRPAILALRLVDRHVVDAGVPDPHQALVVELPVLVPVGPEPLARRVAELVGEAHRDAVGPERPQLLDQPVLQLVGPLPLEEGDDLAAPVEELRAVPPP